MKKILMLCCLIVMACSCETKIEDIQNSILVTQCRLSPPNSVGGCDGYISVKNISGKTIKYVTIYVDFINAVGDAVPCEIKGYGDWLKITGPINHNETFDACWNCVVYNYSAKSLQIGHIDVDYMDGTSIAIEEENLHYVMLNKK